MSNDTKKKKKKTTTQQFLSSQRNGKVLEVTQSRGHLEQGLYPGPNPLYLSISWRREQCQVRAAFCGALAESLALHMCYLIGYSHPLSRYDFSWLFSGELEFG